MPSECSWHGKGVWRKNSGQDREHRTRTPTRTRESPLHDHAPRCTSCPTNSAEDPQNAMSLGYEKLDVYRLSIDYASWVFAQTEALNGVHRHTRDPWLRASQSIALNIAEGNRKTAAANRRRYFEIARESALEFAVEEVTVLMKSQELTAPRSLIPISIAIWISKRTNPVAPGESSTSRPPCSFCSGCC